MRNMRQMAMWGGLLLLAGCGGPSAGPLDHSGPVADWRFYGGDEGGSHFSPATQITPANVEALKPAWTYHIGMLDVPEGVSPTFEATPIVADGRMFVCSGLGKVAAVDPETGKEIWSYTRKTDPTNAYLINCRGVTYHNDTTAQAANAECAARVLVGSVDGRLSALDAKTGQLCPSFGDKGVLDLTKGLGPVKPADYAISSPPVVIDGKIVLGGRVPDNMRVDVPAGVIRAFDLHTGKLAWAWNPLPPGMTDAANAPAGEPYVRATANAWAPLSADPARNLVFVPTGNAGPDHVGIDRGGRDYWSSSIVALDAKTGQPRWRFQTVHHDVWDYDVPAQPTLFELKRDGKTIPALAQATKQGHIFILNRETGEPLFGVEERPVPQDGALPGEKLSPTQPFPTDPAMIVRRDMTEDDMWGFTPWDKAKCRDLFRSANWKGVFTPPSTRGTIFFPSFMGVNNWGGLAIDPVNQIMVVNTTQVPAIVKMVPRAETDKLLAGGKRMLPSFGSPYGNTMDPMLSPFGAPCVKPPWGTLLAIDLKTKTKLWEVPLGSTRDMAPWPMWMNLGVPNMGGAAVTASGVVFIGATTDNFLRAFDIRTGRELWKGRLPAGGQATPVTYRLKKDGKQYVTIAAGGHKYLGTKIGDSLVTFALDTK
ncbi:pyrroloquinoline quinone-dependent dehydrogenase [Sphingomonas sp. KC8]|uniref:pyrroloquinoline quinone-dependent dehydrogenase n=1 Tax=Sphingomonas sp. KC8 TaxID=1030157 RepID=UPI000248A384|nr:pyrroloquinoline quinone-dependent dehydrogenase [Sphingomonas sp. KC8]ARS28168.1 quinoprotein glucose dehydrogenase [Sphingomonas sp. KC8]